MLRTEDAEKAVDWLRDHAQDIGQARAERLYLEAWVKTKRAECMQKHATLPVSAQEREALTDPTYLAALQAYKEAVERDETLRFMATAAEAKIECWRTQESTRRAEGKAYS
jgi:alpha/beta superfamily hydrolase